jgi:hypothetical protein
MLQMYIQSSGNKSTVAAAARLKSRCGLQVNQIRNRSGGFRAPFCGVGFTRVTGVFHDRRKACVLHTVAISAMMAAAIVTKQ